MKVIGILVLAFVLLWLWNQGVFIRFMPSYIKEKRLSEKYGGVYVFYPEFREEIKKRERERQEARDKIVLGDKFWEQMDKVEEKYPQTLSNGCKYHNQAFGPYEVIFEPYYEKIKQFVGEEVYKKLKPSLVITSFYRCEDGSEGLITVWTDIGTTYTEFGIFGNEGTGVYFSQDVDINIGGSNTFELRDGKFVKVDKKSGGLR